MRHPLALPCALFLTAASVPAAALRQKGPMPTSWSPEFVNCNRPGEKIGPAEPNLVKYQSVFGSCGTSLPYMYIRSIVAPMLEYEKQAFIRGSGRLPLIMSIGAGAFGEHGWYRQLLSDLKGRNGNQPYGVVLVEPIEELMASAREKAGELPEENVHFVQAGIYETCAEETVKFYSPDPRLWADHPDLKDLYKTGIGCSFNERDKVAPCTLFHIRHYETYYPLDEKPIANMSAYVKEYVAPCLTPKGLLEKVNQAQAVDVHFLLVDTGGTGRGIVNGFLDLGAKPTYLSFERDGVENKDKITVENRLVSALKEKEYRVGIHCEGDCGQPPYFVKDVVAVSSKVLPSPLLSQIRQAIEGVLKDVVGLVHKATKRFAWRKHSGN